MGARRCLLRIYIFFARARQVFSFEDRRKRKKITEHNTDEREILTSGRKK